MARLLDDSEVMDCPTCAGMGYVDLGDCEDGVTDDCPECNGAGMVPDDTNYDAWDEQIDAFTVNE